MHKNEMAASQVKRMGGNTRNLPLFATRPENVDDVFALRNDFLFGEWNMYVSMQVYYIPQTPILSLPSRPSLRCLREQTRS